MLIGEILSEAAARGAARPAVWDGSRWHTYGELEARANALANFLRAIGTRPGDRVALLFENSADYVVAHFAALKAGAVEVSLNTELTGPNLCWVLDHCEARVLIAAARLAMRGRDHLARSRAVEHLVLDAAARPGFTLSAKCVVHRWDFGAPPISPAEAAPPPPDRIDTDLASIVYTSGSTGDAKGVMLTHRNLVTNTRSIVQYLGLRADDRMMVVLPFHYIYGRSLLYTHFFSGGSIVIDNRFAFPTVVVDAMQTHEVTALAGVPSTFAILLRKTDIRARTLPHLRLLTQAGGGLSPALQREVVDTFRSARFFVMYGATEAAPRLTYVEPEKLPQKWGSIGRAIPDVEVIVADDSGQPLPRRVVGEIAARGENIMRGYWKDPDATARVLRHGYYFTGDLGYVDDDGYIFLTGRSSDIIKSGGNRVSAKEIEDALHEIPGVVEAAVIAMPDEIRGEAITAVIVCTPPPPSEQHVLHLLSQRLPAFKLPNRIEFRDSLPKNASGKIIKSALTSGAGRERRDARPACPVAPREAGSPAPDPAESSKLL